MTPSIATSPQVTEREGKTRELKLRTKQFGLRVIRLIESLPRDQVSKVLGNQLLRSATSVGANYRAACRSKSPADFISKMGIVEEEADESGYWLELIVDAEKMKPLQTSALLQEAGELTAIAVASINTARKTKNATSGNSPPIRSPRSAVRN